MTINVGYKIVAGIGLGKGFHSGREGLFDDTGYDFQEYDEDEEDDDDDD